MKLGVVPIQYLLLLGSEAAWGYPWAMTAGIWIMRTGQPALDPTSLMAILVVGVAATRLASRIRRPRLTSIAVTILAAASIVVAALVQLPAFNVRGDPGLVLNQLMNGGDGVKAAVAAGFAIFLWWRATGIGRSPMSLTVVEDEFQAATIAMTTLLVFVAVAGKASPIPGAPLLLSTLVVVTAGLIGMPLARVVDVGRSQGNVEGSALKLGGPWLTMLLGVVAVLLIGTLLLAQIFTFDRVSAVWDAVAGPVGAALGVVIFVLALPFGLLVQLLIFLASLIPHSGSARPPKDNNDLKWLDQTQQAAPVGLSPEVVFALKVALAVGLVALMVWLIGRAMARLRRGLEGDEVEESHDFVWSWPSLALLWRWLLDRWRPIRARVSIGLIHGSTAGKAAESVRDLYREFLVLGATLGRGRLPAETPLEYQRRLFGDPLLAGREEASSLTEGYNRERYGPPSGALPSIPLLASALGRLRSLWQGRPS